MTAIPSLFYLCLRVFICGYHGFRRSAARMGRCLSTPLMRNRVGAIGGWLVAIALGGFVAGTRALALPPADLEPAIVEYQADSRSVSGFYEMPWSASRFDRLERLQREWQERLKSLDFEKLDRSGRVDFLLLRTQLDSELDDQALSRKRLAEMADLIPLSDEIQAFEEARWRLEPTDAEAAGASLAKLPDRAKQLRERLEQGKKPLPA